MENLNLPALRPLRLGELLDQAIRLYRRNFLTFVGIIALVYIPYVVLQAVLSAILLVGTQNLSSREMITSPAYWLFIGGTLINVMVELIFVGGLGTAALTNATARSYLNQKISILDSYRLLGNSWLHLLIAIFSMSVLSSILSFWTILPIVGWFTGLGATVFLGVTAELLPAITVVEKSKWLDPISRAWNLGRRRFWWLIGVSMILGLFTLLINTGPTLLISTISSSMPFATGTTGIAISSLISTVLSSLLNLVTLPMLIIAKTLIYFDLRIRTEGFDLAIATLEAREGEEIDVASLPIPPSNQRWLTWEEISKFAIISLVIWGLVALIVGVTAIVLTIIQPLL